MNKVTVDMLPDTDSEVGQYAQFVSPDDASFTSGYELIQARSGLNILIQSGTVAGPTLEFEYINSPIEIGFMFAGRSRTLFRHGGCRGLVHEMPQGSTCVSCLPRTAGIVEWGDDATVGVVSIIMSPPLFFETMRENLDDIPRDLLLAAEGRGRKPFLWNGSDCPTKRIALQRILDCPYHGGVRTLFYEGLALELAGCLLHECFSESGCCPRQGTRLSSCEVERIKNARDILIRDLENPPSLTDLALCAGMSDTKLKRGFRAVFGKPIFQYYRDYRLDKAREYLEEGNMNVSQAAYRIGYLSLGHFSRAFSDRFGVTPSRYLQQSRSQM